MDFFVYLVGVSIFVPSKYLQHRPRLNRHEADRWLEVSASLLGADSHDV